MTKSSEVLSNVPLSEQVKAALKEDQDVFAVIAANAQSSVDGQRISQRYKELYETALAATEGELDTQTDLEIRRKACEIILSEESQNRDYMNQVELQRETAKKVLDAVPKHLLDLSKEDKSFRQLSEEQQSELIADFIRKKVLAVYGGYFTQNAQRIVDSLQPPERHPISSIKYWTEFLRRMELRGASSFLQREWQQYRTEKTSS